MLACHRARSEIDPKMMTWYQRLHALTGRQLCSYCVTSTLIFAATPGSFVEVLKTSSDGAHMLGAPSSLCSGCKWSNIPGVCIDGRIWECNADKPAGPYPSTDDRTTAAGPCKRPELTGFGMSSTAFAVLCEHSKAGDQG